MSFGRPYILGIKGAIHDGWASISGFGEKLNSDYLYHYLSSNTVHRYWTGKINSGSVSNLNADIIKTLSIPIPDLNKQKKIALILDKFDALTNSITEGLPREIKLRQQQYEYYRDLLLSFPKPDEVVD
jgi:type I restriction enzyme S subunit